MKGRLYVGDFVLFDSSRGKVFFHAPNSEHRISSRTSLELPGARIATPIITLFADRLAEDPLRCSVELLLSQGNSFGMQIKSALPFDLPPGTVTLTISLNDVMGYAERSKDAKLRPVSVPSLFDEKGYGVDILRWLLSCLTNEEVHVKIEKDAVTWSIKIPEAPPSKRSSR